MLMNDDIKKVKKYADKCSRLCIDEEDITARNLEAIIHTSEQQLLAARMIFALRNFHEPNNIIKCTQTSSELLGISVSEEVFNNTSVYHITLPLFLPNKRSSWELFKKTIAQSVNSCVTDFCRNNNVLPIKNSAVLFISWYGKDKIYINDNDNKEMSIILNAISGINGLITSDNGVECSTHCESHANSCNNHTDIYITEENRFAEFYYQLKKKIK